MRQLYTKKQLYILKKYKDKMHAFNFKFEQAYSGENWYCDKKQKNYAYNFI